MSKPDIQNDFSYYRRTLSRLKMTDKVPRSACATVRGVGTAGSL